MPDFIVRGKSRRGGRAEMSEPAERKPFLAQADLAVPGPEVLGPVAERYGIEVVGPPPRARSPH